MNNSQNVFICYSRKDCEIAQYCNNILQEINVSTFMGVNSLVAGIYFAEMIQKQILNCKILLFVISENSKNSMWTLNEIKKAFEGFVEVRLYSK